MVKILITGANGQLGSEIKALYGNYPQYEFLFTCKEELDITDQDAITSTCKANHITHIINCAAYTAVDKAQSEPEKADAINHQGAYNLALACKELDVSLVHISTDYVFDGKHYKPYTPQDTQNPQSIYGQTKLKGEEAIRKIGSKSTIIIRTSWLYSALGNNFVKTMLRLGKERESLGVVYDQIGAPTYAKDLAKAILDIIPQVQNSKFKIYHYSNEGVLSWYDFAKEIMRMAKLPCNVNPIPTTDYPTPASRPHYSLLDKTQFKSDFNITIPYWKDSLDACLKNLGERK